MAVRKKFCTCVHALFSDTGVLDPKYKRFERRFERRFDEHSCAVPVESLNHFTCSVTAKEELRTMRRTIVIGDVHGCAEEFEALLLALKLKLKDRVFQVGDLVNRGPDSHRTIELAKEYNVSCVLGNHEIRLLKAKKQNSVEGLRKYDLSTMDQLTKTDWKFLKKMPPYIHKPKRKTVIVHAGFMPKPVWHKQDIYTITQIQVIDADGNAAKRDAAPDAPSWADHWQGAPFVVYGHTARPEVYKRPGSIGIDTGCVFGGHLTAFTLEDQSIIQIPAKKKYA